jgi:hypothetical protein
MATSRASKKIQGLKDKGNIEGLIKLLKRGRSVELRMGAAEALGRCPLRGPARQASVGAKSSIWCPRENRR